MTHTENSLCLLHKLHSKDTQKNGSGIGYSDLKCTEVTPSELSFWRDLTTSPTVSQDFIEVLQY